MFRIRRFACEGLSAGCVTDNSHPVFSYSVESSRNGACLAESRLSVNGLQAKNPSQIAAVYEGGALSPFTVYHAHLTAIDDQGAQAHAEVTFETGRMNTPWEARWITDGSYRFTEKAVSPVPMTFRKKFSVKKPVESARVYATAMGIYELELNAQKVGDEYFAPGFTSYKTRLQYQTYDVTSQLQADNTLTAHVAGGWAVGSFVFTRKNRVYAERQALLLEVRVTYTDGTSEVIGTDESWQVTMNGPFRMADIYDGETYDAVVDIEKADWHAASIEKLRINPRISAASGLPVRRQELMKPISCTRTKDGLIYDFGQNFAGVVNLNIFGSKGQEITVKHAEILNPDGSLNTAFLRTAKACATYICRDGQQTYSPRLTYMGFRYICISGIEQDAVDVTAYALYSDLERTGDFSCSNEMLNQLQSNIVWSAKSNFVDIPTDCPQRDERMGWTGDIALFSPVACASFNMRRFLEKWMDDLSAEQLPSGGIPNTIPLHGYGFPATMPTIAVDFWGDACILVPWAEYQARGDVRILEKYYDTMKKYVDACKFWAGLFSFGANRYIWHTFSMLHFGDWVAPDVPLMSQWQKRSKWTATASLCNTSGLLAKIARLLGRQDDARKYGEMSRRTAEAYCKVFTDGKGKLKEEFQTAYVLPLHFGMFSEEQRQAAADNLVSLVEKNDYCIGTGFPGTPFILFALADNGHADTAYRMLMNTKCPSWLYEVRVGATTIWERWDGLDENGVCPIGDDGTDKMISYNHYASGAVGDFFFKRIAGLEAIEPGYKRFKVVPIPGGGLTSAKAHVETPYGRAVSDWHIKEGVFHLTVHVPMGTVCEVTLPDGLSVELESGEYCLQAALED